MDVNILSVSSKVLNTSLQKIAVLDFVVDVASTNYSPLLYGIGNFTDIIASSILLKYNGLSPLSVGGSDAIESTAYNFYRSANNTIQLRKNNTIISEVQSENIIPIFVTFTDGVSILNIIGLFNTTVNNYLTVVAPTETSYGALTTNGNVGQFYQFILTQNISFYADYKNDFTTIHNNAPDWGTPTDPYDGAGDSTTGGGDGTFDGSSDPVDFPNLPSLSAVNTGFISLFVPTQSQLQQVANYMWSSLFDVSTFFKLFEDPMDCILGLSVVPVSVPTSGNAQITVGNIELSGITLPLASQQYVEVDCGSISFANKYFGSYLDYEPYTKMAIFLPYCGTHQINADDVMGKTIHVKYHIDILTGSCVAFVKCGDSVLYEYNGACASNIPVNSINYASTIENAIRIAVNIGTTVATAGASAPLTGATEAMTTAQNIGRGISLAGSTAEGALSLKPNISRSGALGGSVGILGNQTPYIIITRPRLCKPKNQDFFEGYPSFIQTTIGDLVGKGYTSFTDVVISSQYLTDAEEQELEGILKGGIYL